MKNFSNISKYKLQEALYIVGFFVVVFIINLLIDRYDDFPAVRGAAGAVFLGLITAWYEIVISPKLQKRINTFLLWFISMLFYYVVFSIILILYGYVNLIFKVGLTVSQALDVSILDFTLMVHMKCYFTSLCF